jgi:hypothetical protein
MARPQFLKINNGIALKRGNSPVVKIPNSINISMNF